MARTAEKSLEDLQTLIEAKKAELEDLKKSKLMTELKAVESEIAELTGKAATAKPKAAAKAAPKPAAKKPAAKAAPAEAPKRRGRPPGSGGGKRPKNTMSLKALCVELLTKNKKGLTLEDIITKTQESGYKSSASNFKTVVYQTLYNADEIVRDKATKLYVLSK
ncbi:MAG: hypothetical protein AAF532_11825 [Planctomycetota bacterium]